MHAVAQIRCVTSALQHRATLHIVDSLQEIDIWKCWMSVPSNHVLSINHSSRMSTETDNYFLLTYTKKMSKKLSKDLTLVSQTLSACSLMFSWVCVFWFYSFFLVGREHFCWHRYLTTKINLGKKDGVGHIFFVVPHCDGGWNGWCITTYKWCTVQL